MPSSLLSLAAYIRRNRIQLIHCTEKPRDAFYGVLLGKLTGAKSLIHMHVNYGEWQSRNVRWALRHADAIVGVSRFTAESIITAGLPRERVFVVHNSLDMSGSEWHSHSDAELTRRELGIPSDAAVLGLVARLFQWKGHGDMLEALPLITREFPNVRLVFVGEDDSRAHPGGGSYRAELEVRARALGLEQNVCFTGFRTDIPRVMDAFDIYTMPTWEEPFGMVFLEAMAMRKPVLAWAIGGPLEIILDGRTGFLVPPKSIRGLADATLRLLRDLQLRQDFGHAGRRRVEEVFTPASMCQSMLDVYRATLGRDGSQVHSMAAHQLKRRRRIDARPAH